MEYVLTVVCLLLPVSVATVVSFDGSQHVRIELNEESRTEAEDIALRFQTSKANGLLFATTSSSTPDRLELMLDAGRLRMDLDLGSGTKVSRSTIYSFSLKLL